MISVRIMADLGESAAPSSPGAVALFFKRIGDVCFTVLIFLYIEKYIPNTDGT